MGADSAEGDEESRETVNAAASSLGYILVPSGDD
jgi:hypothetical protein